LKERKSDGLAYVIKMPRLEDSAWPLTLHLSIEDELLYIEFVERYKD
jgi:hypothetical protein